MSLEPHPGFPTIFRNHLVTKSWNSPCDRSNNNRSSDTNLHVSWTSHGDTSSQSSVLNMHHIEPGGTVFVRILCYLCWTTFELVNVQCVTQQSQKKTWKNLKKINVWKDPEKRVSREFWRLGVCCKKACCTVFSLILRCIWKVDWKVDSMLF